MKKGRQMSGRAMKDGAGRGDPSFAAALTFSPHGPALYVFIQMFFHGASIRHWIPCLLNLLECG